MIRVNRRRLEGKRYSLKEKTYDTNRESVLDNVFLCIAGTFIVCSLYSSLHIKANVIMSYLKLDRGMLFNGVSMFTIDMKEYKRAKQAEKDKRYWMLTRVFPTLWSALLVLAVLPTLPVSFT